jgi:hypothetical protein
MLETWGIVYQPDILTIIGLRDSSLWSFWKSKP